MGQKANPTSLRLKKTNKSFNSCWYSDIYYSNLLSQEFRAKQYLSNIFKQIKYPHPHLSFSLFPKKTKAMAIYLNPIESRRRRCERFQLKLVQGTMSIASDGSGRAGSRYYPHFSLTDDSSKMVRDQSLASWRIHQLMPPFGHCVEEATNHLLLPIARDGYPLGNAARGRRFFVYRLLLSIAIRKGTGERLAWKKDFELFQKLHRLTWFQGREESSSFLVNKKELTEEEYRRTKIESANYNLKRRSRIGRSFPATLRDCLPHAGTYNASQTLSSTNSDKRGFSTFFNSGLSVPHRRSSCFQLAIAQRKRWASNANRIPQEWLVFFKASLRLREVNTGYDRCSIASFASAPSHSPPRRPGVAHEPLEIQHTLGRAYPRHQQNLYPQLPSRRRDHIHVNLLESTIEKGVGSSTSLCFYKSAEDGQAASFLSEEIAYYLERRVPFRRIKQLLLRELRTDYIEGVRVSCSGRVGGRSKKAQRARGERFQWGQTSSHVFSSRLSFAFRSALTPFGKVGIKVWICYK